MIKLVLFQGHKDGSTALYQVPHLVQYLVHRPALVTPRYQRYGTVSAMPVAPLADFDVGVVAGSGQVSESLPKPLQRRGCLATWCCGGRYLNIPPFGRAWEGFHHCNRYGVLLLAPLTPASLDPSAANPCSPPLAAGFCHFGVFCFWLCYSVQFLSFFLSYCCTCAVCE